MPSYTVTEILNTRPWSPNGATEPQVIYYDFKVDGEPRQINTGRKPTNPLTVGTVLEGTLETDGRGNGLKFVRSQNGGAGGRGRSPEESARITRMHSQSVAVESFIAQGNTAFTIDQLKQRIDWFDADAKAVKP